MCLCIWRVFFVWAFNKSKDYRQASTQPRHTAGFGPKTSPLFNSHNRSSFSSDGHMQAWGQGNHPLSMIFTFSRIRARKTGTKRERGLQKTSQKLNLWKMQQGPRRGWRGLQNEGRSQEKLELWKEKTLETVVVETWVLKKSVTGGNSSDGPLDPHTCEDVCFTACREHFNSGRSGMYSCRKWTEVHGAQAELVRPLLFYTVMYHTCRGQ